VAIVTDRQIAAPVAAELATVDRFRAAVNTARDG
jgi:hypothetical protein